MSIRRLYVAPIPEGPGEEAQEAAFSGTDFDEIIIEDVLAADGSPKAWNALQPHLACGDHLALFSLDLLPFKQPTLNKLLFDLLERGITIELAMPALVITSTDSDPAFALIRAFEARRRRELGRSVSSGLKNAPRQGRQARLNVSDLPDIQRMLRDPALSRSEICARLKVTRSTLYKFLARHKLSAEAREEIDDTDAQRPRDL